MKRERRGFIEDDDGFKVGYIVISKNVFRDGIVVGFVEDGVAYKRTKDGPIPIGRAYFEDD